jgi:hypothetical protein
MRYYIYFILHTLALAFFMITLKRMLTLEVPFTTLMRDPSLLFASAAHIKTILHP